MKKHFLLTLTLITLTTQPHGSCCSKPKAKPQEVVAPVTKQPEKKVERTFAMIKPEAVEKGYTGDIIKLIEQNGFTILHMEKRTLTKDVAQRFYSEHKGKPFYNDLVNYMTSGPVIVLALEKENAIADWRELLGATDPAEAKMGTVRKMYAESKSKNAAHGSDSINSAPCELSLMFS